MRVTNGMITSNYLKNISNNLKLLDKYQKQVSTNRRITRLSDDPVGVLESMRARVKLYRLEQYKENTANVQSWLKQTETSVMELNEVLKSAYEASLEAANTYMSDEDKQATAELVGELRDQALVIGNTRIGDKYVFGGYNTEKAPFEINASGKILYNGLDLSDSTNPDLIAEDGQVIQYEIGFGMMTDVSVTGTQLMGMGPDNIYAVLDGLYSLLAGNGSPEEIAVYTSKLQTSQSDVLALAAEIGGKTNRLELVANRYEQDILNYTDMKSKVEDADIAEVITQFKMAEAVYTASLKIGADIIQPTLVDFL